MTFNHWNSLQDVIAREQAGINVLVGAGKRQCDAWAVSKVVMEWVSDVMHKLRKDTTYTGTTISGAQAVVLEGPNLDQLAFSYIEALSTHLFCTPTLQQIPLSRVALLLGGPLTISRSDFLPLRLFLSAWSGGNAQPWPPLLHKLPDLRLIPAFMSNEHIK